MDRTAVKPTGLLPGEITALRKGAGVDRASFAEAFGVSANVVERWESRGVPSGPTALAIRLVADSMDFEFPEEQRDATSSCRLCGGPASDHIHELPVCKACFQDPVKSMEAVGFEVTRTQNHVTGYDTLAVELPAGREFPFQGRFVSEGLGTMLTKLFKDEPQLGVPSWDDAVYVAWVEPNLEALGSDASRALLKALVGFGLVEVFACSIEVQYAGGADEEIVLTCGLLASDFA